MPLTSNRKPPSPGRALLLAPIVVLLLHAVLACSEDPNNDSNPFREDVVRCEDAIAHATSCCHGLVVAPPGACRFSHWLETCGGGCEGPHGTPGSADTWPVLSVDESSLLEGESCAAIDCAEVEDKISRDHSSETKGSLDCY